MGMAEPPGTGERGCLGMATEYRGGAVLWCYVAGVEGVKSGSSWFIHFLNVVICLKKRIKYCSAFVIVIVFLNGCFSVTFFCILMKYTGTYIHTADTSWWHLAGRWLSWTLWPWTPRGCTTAPRCDVFGAELFLLEGNCKVQQ